MLQIKLQQATGWKEETREVYQLTTAGQNKKKKKSAYIPECMLKLNISTPMERDRQASLTTRHLCFLLIHKLAKLLPTTHLKEQTLPSGLCTYSRTSPDSPSPTHFNYRQCKIFFNYIFFSKLCKTVCQSQNSNHVAFAIWP